MVDEVSIEVLAPERLEEMRAEQLAKLDVEVDALVVAINRREVRDFLRSLDNPLHAAIEDAQLPLMRSRLVQRRAQLAVLLSKTATPYGVEDPGLDTAPPEDRALTAVEDLLIRMVRRRALPVEDPLISDEEVEEEHERQTRKQLGPGPGSGQARRGPVRGR